MSLIVTLNYVYSVPNCPNPERVDLILDWDGIGG